MGQTMKMRTDYLNRAFGSLDSIADNLLECSDKWTYRELPDTLVGTGLSGSLVVPGIARILGLYWAIVRKEDGSHSNRKIEGEIGQKWIFVDDLISSGDTLRRVQSIVSRECGYRNHETRYLGTYQYEYQTFQAT